MFKKLLLLMAICSFSACHSSSSVEPTMQTVPHIRGPQVNFDGTHELRAAKFGQHYILEGLTSKKLVALTFDDGPSQHTLDVLKVAKNYQIPVTFFMLGAAMQKQPDIVQHAFRLGHQIANHSWDHTDAQTYATPEALWQSQIAPQMDISQQIIGESSSYFRPPFGSINNEQVHFLAEKNITTVIWSIDTIDWNELDNAPQTLVKRATLYSHPGAIILMHDGGGNRSNTIHSLSSIIRYYQQNGYTFVRLDTLLSSNSISH